MGNYLEAFDHYSVPELLEIAQKELDRTRD